jgi:hypothetical protein
MVTPFYWIHWGFGETRRFPRTEHDIREKVFPESEKDMEVN